MPIGTVENGKRGSVGAVLIVLIADAAFYLASSTSIPLFSQKASPEYLTGLSLAVIPLGCMFVYLWMSAEDRKIRLRMEMASRDLAAEKAMRLKVEEDLRQTMDGLERKLEESVLFSTVIENSEDNVLITDRHRTILYINPAFERSSGYTCSDLKGKSLRHLRSDQHGETFFQTMKDSFDRGEVWMGVIINRGKDGIDFEIEGSISPIRDSAGEISHWVAVGRNMSRFRKLERELERAQKLDALGTSGRGDCPRF